MLNRAQLPDNVDELQVLLSAQWAEMDALKLECDTLHIECDALKQTDLDNQQAIQRLSLLLDMLKRKLFGQKSEKLNRQIDQLELALEALHISQGERIPAQQPEAEVNHHVQHHNAVHYQSICRARHKPTCPQITSALIAANRWRQPIA